MFTEILKKSLLVFIVSQLLSCVTVPEEQARKYVGTHRSDHIEIVPISSAEFLGEAYKLTYIIDEPVNKVWDLKQRLPDALYLVAPGIIEYITLSKNPREIITQVEYSLLPGKKFWWKYTFYPAQYTIKFKLINPEKVDQKHHFGEIKLYQQDNKTKIVQTGYVNFTGVSNWINDLSHTGLNAFFITSAQWEQKMFTTNRINKKTISSINVFKPEGKYYALVIGNNKYRYLKPLKSSVWDAQSITKILVNNFGFKVTLLLDAGRDDIVTQIHQYRQQLKTQDHLLIYYAGHGWLDKETDEGYWWPVDARADNPVNWIANNSITTSLKGIPARHIILIADSCYSGKLTRGVGRIKQNDEPGYLEKMDKKKSRTVMTSGGLEPVLDSGGKNEHSVFASAFIEALDQIEQASDAALLFTKIRENVLLNADQTPEYNAIRKSGHAGGDFIFSRKP